MSTHPFTANLRTKILDSRGSDSSGIVDVQGWNSQARRESPGKFESTNLSLEILGMETGRVVVFLLKIPEISIESLEES